MGIQWLNTLFWSMTGTGRGLIEFEVQEAKGSQTEGAIHNIRSEQSSECQQALIAFQTTVRIMLLINTALSLIKTHINVKPI